ncbi:hypothetical protein [Novosphingobium sp. M1R2S20]|uniref:Uncharacterized protein n=1 Tax=Novosphingobium rhizovicinum TaxID=3228928 RepID=A0ABV3RDK5_9SPHN
MQYFLTREEIAKVFPDSRSRQRFDLMQRAVGEAQEAVGANVGETQTLKEATYLTLSANTELTNERIFRWSNGLQLSVDANFATLGLTTEVPRSSGGFRITFVGEGDSTVAVPLNGRLATTSNPEHLENKVLVSPKLAGLGDYADDAAAAAAGVDIEGLYRTGSTLKIRAA